MTPVPTGDEIAIYEDVRRKPVFRILVGLTESQWVAEIDDDFSSGIRRKYYKSTYHHDDKVALIGGLPTIQGRGGPPYEEFSTTEHFLPFDEDTPFRLESSHTFDPAGDPVYSNWITIYSVESYLGVDGDPLRAIHKGSAYSGDDGEVGIFCGGSEVATFANDSAPHVYAVEWNPAATAVPGDHKLTMYLDGDVIAEFSANARPPWGVQVGAIQPVRVDIDKNIIPGLGTVASPVPLITTQYIKSTDLGGGFEAAAYPSYTVPNDGGDIDDAGPGERFDDGGITWYKMPHDFIRSMQWNGETIAGIRKGSVSLASEDEDVGALVANERWRQRPVRIDFKMVGPDDPLTSGVEAPETAWRRLGQFVCDDTDVDGDGAILKLTCEVGSTLNVSDSRVFIGVEADDTAEGEPDFAEIGKNVQEIFEDMAAAALSLSPHSVPDFTTTVNAPDIVPLAYDTGGGSLASAYYGLADRLAQWVYVRNYVDAAPELFTHLAFFGTGTPVWTFYGKGSDQPATILGSGPKLLRPTEGPARVFYRQSNPLQTEQLLTTQLVPIVGLYPSGAIGPGRTLEDSIAVIDTAGLSPLQAFPDLNGDPMYGGVARFRWINETLKLRRVTFDVDNQDWPQVTHEIAIDAPARGITPDETWIVEAVDFGYQNSTLTATITARTTSLRKALRHA